MVMDLSEFCRRQTEIELGNRKFTFSELTIGDLAEFRATLVKQKENMRDKRRDRMLADAEKIGNIDRLELLKMLDAPVTDDEVEAEMETTGGMAELAYLSLRAAHPGISREQTAQIVTPAYAEQIMAAIFPGLDKKKPTPTTAVTLQQP